MTRNEIMNYLPHRERMLLLDEVELLENSKVRATYCIKEDEFFIQGHFPNAPVVPGVILCEIMAQASAFTVKEKLQGNITLYSGIQEMKFKHAVYPKDVVEIESELMESKLNLYFCRVRAKVSGKVCAFGTLSFALVEDKR